MTKARRYPGADLSRFVGDQFDGRIFSELEKIVLHSTETSPKWGCPGYDGGKKAPTLTVDPWNKRVWQHFDLNESARALVNPTSTTVSENKDNVCQIEIVGYSDPKIAKTYGYFLDDMGEDEIDFLAGVIAFIANEWGVPLARPALWPLYPASYGASPARMTSSQYDAFRGVLGHLHASGNTHGDPRLPQIDAILAKARALNSPPQTEEDMPLTQDDLDKIENEVLWAPLVPGRDGLPGSSVRNNLNTIVNNSIAVRAEVAALAAVVAKIASAQSGLTPEQVLAASKEGAAQALAERITDARVELEVAPAGAGS